MSNRPDAWINEFHYDNVGTDVNEFVEVLIRSDGAPSEWSVHLYNGANGAVYQSQTLPTPSLVAENVGLYMLEFPRNIQNGPDGIALVQNEEVREFWSYPSAITATSGPAQGQTATVLPISQNSNTPINTSLQRIDCGWAPAWRSSLSTPGSLNEGQTEDCLTSDIQPPAVAWFNEIHYANEGEDADELVEIVFVRPLTLEGWTLVRYNGNNGRPYGDTINLQDWQDDSTDLTLEYVFVTVRFPTNGLQNGPDGLVLIEPNGNISEFISYGGSFDADRGPAVGLTAVDIGVTQSSFTKVNMSLQLRGAGCRREDFVWDPQVRPPSPGSVNELQCLGGEACSSTSPVCGRPIPDKCPASSTCTRFEDIRRGFVEDGTSVVSCPAVVTLVQDNGFFLQHSDGSESRSLSSGMYVFTRDVHPLVATNMTVGDLIQVCGTATEFGDLTEIILGDWVLLNANVDLIPPHTTLTLPNANLEAYEGMLVEVEADALVISELFELDRYGRIVACAADPQEGRVYQFSQTNEPDRQGYDRHLDRIRQSCMFVDDNLSIQNPNPVQLGGFIDVNSTDVNVRAGNVITVLRGVLFQVAFARSSYSYGVQPRVPSDLVVDTSSNQRPAVPQLTEGSLNVTSTNLLNFFVRLDGRGADTELELERQRGKLLTALSAMNTDIFGVIELENSVTAVNELLSAMNERLPGRMYRAASLQTDETKGTDAIRSDVFYDANRMTLVGVSTLDDSDSQARKVLDATGTGAIFNGPGTSRVPIAATLRLDDTGELVTVVALHLKSKGGTITSGPNADRRNGAGRFNQIRLHAVQALSLWLDDKPTGFDLSNHSVVLLGDFNAYAKEDPIQFIMEEGFVSVEPLDPPSYSYVFSAQWGTLDYMFVSDGGTVVDHATWHINSDEPDLFDYQTEFRLGPGGMPVNPFDPTNPARFSDHDPLVASFNLTKFSGPPSSGAIESHTFGFGSAIALLGLIVAVLR